MQPKKNYIDYGIHIFLIVLALLTIIPFYTVVLQSIATPTAIAKQPIYLIPTTIDFASFKFVLGKKETWDSLKVSLVVTVVGMALNMILTVCGAYALSKKHLPGVKIFMALIVFQFLFNGGLVPTYLTMKSFGLLDSLFSMILPVAVSTYYLIIMLNYFKTIPEALEESAKIDGGNDIQILFRIILPISMPTLVTIGLFYTVDRWNEWYNAMIYLKDTTKFPLQLFLRELLSNIGRLVSGDDTISMNQLNGPVLYLNGIKMAMVVVTILPIVAIYPWLQRYFTSGVRVGSVKE